ncbi:hypothetical protein Nepgr_022638 [Nepenthes gracilis]|uniref:Uncharacterized protein n=1 Tax=Nepenthes gracilis TaxID=150966 RepID=A0AAD3T2Y6_NEPGR|nr:hypothetical protein Nepgr_022638 [Nepenthes gracilis]
MDTQSLVRAWMQHWLRFSSEELHKNLEYPSPSTSHLIFCMKLNECCLILHDITIGYTSTLFLQDGVGVNRFGIKGILSSFKLHLGQHSSLVDNTTSLVEPFESHFNILQFCND